MFNLWHFRFFPAMRSTDSLSWRRSLRLWPGYPPASALLGISGSCLNIYLYWDVKINCCIYTHTPNGIKMKCIILILYPECCQKESKLIVMSSFYFRLNSSDQDGEPMYIQMVTALVLCLIQCVVHLPNDKDVFEEYDKVGKKTNAQNKQIYSSQYFLINLFLFLWYLRWIRMF